MERSDRTLGAIVDHLDELEQIPKNSLFFGDWLRITTLDAIYSIYVVKEGSYMVSGGWFDRHEVSPFKTTIAGCTWGGSAIKIDIVAALGLHLEFGNRLVSSPIQKIEMCRLETDKVN
ncbi:MAG: hypothetical protein V3R94_02775 [Acidobacteriota bacterium]